MDKDDDGKSTKDKVDKDKDGKSTNKDDKKSRDSKSTTRQDKRSKSNTKDRQKGQKSDLVGNFSPIYMTMMTMMMTMTRSSIPKGETQTGLR